MMRIVGEVAIAVGSSLALSLLVKATAVSLCALTTTYIARRGRASVRHLVLATAFAVLLVLPLMSLASAPRDLAVPVLQAGPPLPFAALAPSSGSVSVSGAAESAGLSGVVPTGGFPSISAVLSMVWFSGVAIFLTPMIAGWVRVRRLRRSGLPWGGGQAIVAGIAASTAVRKRVQLLLHEAAIGPMTCGVLRPVIILPPDASTWHPEDLRRAIVHELEHIRRGDWLTLCISRAVCSLYWFHPLVWISWRQLRLEAERVCDDAVLRMTPREAYADQLVTLAERLLSSRTESLRAMADRGDLGIRVSAVLDERQPRGPAGSLWAGAVLTAAILLLGAIAPLRAVAVPQADSSPSPAGARFEVASIRPSISGGRSTIRPMPNGRLIAESATLRSLILRAYRLHESQLIGGPDWIGAERFDIDARVESAPPGGPEALVPMLRTLLAERFQLRAHDETHALPAYALVLARKDGRLGPGIRPTLADCSTAPSVTGSEIIISGKDGWPPCGMSSTAPVTTPGDAGVTISATIRRSAVQMTDLATMFQSDVARPVVDRTGLAGRFDVEYSYVLRQPPDQTAQPAVTSFAPTIFVAIEEQLGLKLESQRTNVPVLVIDSVERPSEN